MTGRAAEVFGVNKQLQELMAAEEGQEHRGGLCVLGMSSVPPKGAGKDVEHPMAASPVCWQEGPCISRDPEVSKGTR